MICLWLLWSPSANAHYNFFSLCGVSISSQFNCWHTTAWLTDWQQTYWQTVGRTNLRSRVNFRRPFQCWYVAGFCWTHLPLVGTQDDGEKKVFALQHRTTTVSGGVVVIVLICLDKLMQSLVRCGIVRSAKDNNNCGKKRVNYARPANKVCLNLLPWRWRARGVC